MTNTHKTSPIVTEENLASMKRLYLRAQKAYYNGDEGSEPILSDRRFDKLEDGIRKLDPNWSKLKKTGVAVKNKKTEVEHEHYLPSLNKAYPEDWAKWLNKNAAKRYIVMAKLDGSSLALTYEKGKPVRLVTRGDGERGGDVSFLITALVKHRRIPARIGSKSRLTFRVEAIMRARTFEKNWSVAAKGEKEGFENARNMVNGLFNRTTAHPALSDTDIVVLGIYGYNLEDSLDLAQAWDFSVVPWAVMTPRDVANLTMQKVLDTFGKTYLFDGAVVATDVFALDYDNADKPKRGIIAYKENDEANATQAKVLEVIWQKARTGRWTPKIRIKPTEMDGVIVEFATAHNAQWMYERGIGVGAVVKVLRSGGVIPKIVGVTKKADLKALPPGKVEWRGVHLYDTMSSADEHVEQILFFLTTMGVEFIAAKGVAKLFDLGYKTPRFYLKAATYERVPPTMVEGLGRANAAKVFAQMKAAFANPKLLTVMVASQTFGEGIGHRKLAQLESGGLALADLVKAPNPAEKLPRILTIAGFSHTTALKIVEGAGRFKVWLAENNGLINIDMSKVKAKRVPKGALNGVVVSFTGYRDKSQEALIEQRGGSVINFGSKTMVLLYKEGGKESSKVGKAGDRAMTWEDFCAKYKVK